MIRHAHRPSRFERLRIAAVHVTEFAVYVFGLFLVIAAMSLVDVR